jgi:hypothetical protein
MRLPFIKCLVLRHYLKSPYFSQSFKTFIGFLLVTVWHIRHVLMSDDGETEALLNEVKYGKLRYL